MADPMAPLEPEVQGQGTETPPEGQGAAPPSEVIDDGQGHFYSYTDPVKNETKSFKTQEELTDHVSNLSKSYNELRGKFTRTTQEYAERGRKYENDRAALLQQRAEFDKRREEIAHLDDFLKKNPHVYREIKSKMGKGPQGADLQEMIDSRLKETYGKEFEELKAKNKRQEVEAARENAFQAIQKKYGDVNKDEIFNKFNVLSQGNLEDVLELIHLSTRTAPGAAKQQAGLLPSQAGAPSKGGGTQPFKSIDEWVEANQHIL